MALPSLPVTRVVISCYLFIRILVTNQSDTVSLPLRFFGGLREVVEDGAYTGCWATIIWYLVARISWTSTSTCTSGHPMGLHHFWTLPSKKLSTTTWDVPSYCLFQMQNKVLDHRLDGWNPMSFRIESQIQRTKLSITQHCCTSFEVSQTWFFSICLKMHLDDTQHVHSWNWIFMITWYSPSLV